MAEDTKATALIVTDRGLAIGTLDEAYRFSKYVAASGLAPKGDTAETVLVKLQACKELGLPVMRGLATMAVVNGRLGLMGELVLAMIRNSGVCEFLDTGADGIGDERIGWIRFKRKDSPKQIEIVYSVKEAKIAHLWGKSGSWSSDPDSMLIWRAVGRAGKRYFSDVTFGLEVVEVAKDYEDTGRRGPADSPKPPPGPDPLMAAVEAEGVQIAETPQISPLEPEPAALEPQGEAITPEAISEVAPELALAVAEPDADFDVIPLPDPDTQSAIDAVTEALAKIPPKKSDYLSGRFCDWQGVKVWHHSRDVEALKQLWADAKETAKISERVKK